MIRRRQPGDDTPRPLRTRRVARKALSYALLSVAALIVLFPFLWMFSSSLKTVAEIFQYPPLLFPQSPQWSNYPAVMESFPFLKFILNSLISSALPAIGQMVTCSLAAYVFAWKRFPGREVAFVLILATLMLPYQTTLIPTYVLMRYLGWLDTLRPLIVPGFLGGAFGTFLLRQFFLTIPRDLIDAAKMDGCSDFGIYRHVLLPLSRPALTTVGIFIFMLHWNDLLRPVIYLSSYQKMTLTVGLAFLKGQHRTEWSLLMAGAVISMVPMLILYLAAQRYFEEGMLLSGIKG